MKDVKVCVACGKPKVNRPRGMCWTCYYTPGLKEKFPSGSKYARRGVGNLTGEVPIDPQGPTTAMPGTPEKLLVMEDRARRRVQIFHPDDKKYVVGSDDYYEPEEEDRDREGARHKTFKPGNPRRGRIARPEISEALQRIESFS